MEYTAGGLALLPPYVPLRSVRRWAGALLGLSGALAAVSLGVEIAQLRLLLQPVAGEAARALARTAQEATGGTLAVIRLVLFAATAAAVLAWVYHARANVRALGVRRPRFTRGDAVAAFVVPGLNLIRPYAVLVEIWQASHPAILDPFGWRAAPVPRLLRGWWLAFSAWLALAGLALTLEATAGVILGRLRFAAALSGLSDAAACVAALLSALLMAQIGDAQQAKWERLRAARGAAPDPPDRSETAPSAPAAPFAGETPDPAL